MQVSSTSTTIKGLAAVLCGLATTFASAAPLYFNGFETDTAFWSNVTRVASGTGGVASSSGGFHATASTTSGGSKFTNFGGYNYGAGSVPTAFQAFSTSIDIYLNVAGGYANDSRFDYSSAISAATGGHLQDYVFNAGFYAATDATGPGANTDRFVISAGTNAGRANSFPKNAGAIAITSTGWYTFEHDFYESGGLLRVDMSIFDSSNSLVHSWTLGAQPMAGVGGSRYGWLVNNELGSMALDNSELNLTPTGTVPLPGTMALVGLALLGLAATKRRKPD